MPTDLRCCDEIADSLRSGRILTPIPNPLDRSSRDTITILGSSVNTIIGNQAEALTLTAKRTPRDRPSLSVIGPSDSLSQEVTRGDDRVGSIRSSPIDETDGTDLRSATNQDRVTDVLGDTELEIAISMGLGLAVC